MAGLPSEPAGKAPRGPSPLLTVVVPVRNEGPNILPLVREIAAALSGTPHEIVYVDDGSTDETSGALARAAAHHGVRALRHAESCGQSAAIVTGIRAASGAWIATLDGDGQNDPADIPALLRRAREETGEEVGTGADEGGRKGAGERSGPILVAGHRVDRRDTAAKRLSSRVANRVRARLLGDATPDTGCGLKVFGREAFLELPQFDHMHRFLPALFLRQGGRVVSVPVGHRPRMRGTSNYGTLDRLWVGIFDLAGVAWLQRRWTRPTRIEPLPPEP